MEPRLIVSQVVVIGVLNGFKKVAESLFLILVDRN